MSMLPEGISTVALGITAAEAYPQDFEGFKSDEQLSVTDLVIELAREDDRTIVDALKGYIEARELTVQVANYIIDQIAILQDQTSLQYKDRYA